MTNPIESAVAIVITCIRRTRERAPENRADLAFNRALASQESWHKAEEPELVPLLRVGEESDVGKQVPIYAIEEGELLTKDESVGIAA